MRVMLRTGRGRAPLGAAEARRWAARVVKAVRGAAFARSSELSVVFTGDAEVRRLNRLWRGKDKTTDVLAFPLREGKALKPGLPGAGALGDVVISLPQARRQAKAAGKPPREEAALLLTHGILHLLGFDHATKRQEKRMFGLQAEILRKLPRRA